MAHVCAIHCGQCNTGLMVLAAAKAFSASSVAITDIRPDNLPVAKQLGAKHALDQSQATSASDIVQALKAVFAESPDIVIDSVGFESTSRYACLLVACCSASPRFCAYVICNVSMLLRGKYCRWICNKLVS